MSPEPSVDSSDLAVDTSPQSSDVVVFGSTPIIVVIDDDDDAAGGIDGIGVLIVEVRDVTADGAATVAAAITGPGVMDGVLWALWGEAEGKPVVGDTAGLIVGPVVGFEYIGGELDSVVGGCGAVGGLAVIVGLHVVQSHAVPPGR